MAEENIRKILIIGESGVGKTSLFIRYFRDEFITDPSKQIPTIGVDCANRKIKIGENEILLQVWDTAGNHAFMLIVDTFYRGVEGIILCYDITSRESFFELEVWTNKIKEKADKNAIVYLVGTKLDEEHRREVPLEEVQDFAKAHDFKHFETSSKESLNIENVFESMAKEVIIKRIAKGIMLSDVKKDPKKERKNKCC